MVYTLTIDSKRFQGIRQKVEIIRNAINSSQEVKREIEELEK